MINYGYFPSGPIGLLPPDPFPMRLLIVALAIMFAFSFASGLNDTDKIQDRHPAYEMQEVDDDRDINIIGRVG